MNDPILTQRTLRIPRCLPRVWLASLLALFVAGLASRAGLILDLPDLTLEPNQANQSFTIHENTYIHSMWGHGCRFCGNTAVRR